MTSFRKAFALFAVAAVLVVTGTFVQKTMQGLLPVEHDRSGVIYDHDSRTAVIVEHDRN